MNEDNLIDARGKPCPVPVIELAAAVEASDTGEVVLLLADDPAARTDVAVWCRMKRHELVSVTETDGALQFEVRVGEIRRGRADSRPHPTQ
jgi:TusA-related sulfurtransferase